ncbi:Permease of the drug/metabolite transporter (DMT) superfamily [Desulfosporosinus metallidurans]|uniref:Permease of the drug/metabolite transporter (DMT) superfamily n=1 Tax=Desulfosporosinus metallidurans TaxID=1888891 RepID=A0A1Q8QLC3_9FIRM|nr:Permease of the drug/metabolite transporter (DMT) superfamily [Desulfosporosinus metallidurans]
MTKYVLKANLAMVTVIIIWGISYVSIKATLIEIPPITMALIRFMIASLILGMIIRKVEPKAKLDKSDLPKMVLGGIFASPYILSLKTSESNLPQQLTLP